MKVSVYWNSHKKCWSVKEYDMPVFHSENICLKNCELRVNPSGLKRARKEKKKNVHAFVVGEVCSLMDIHKDLQYELIRYSYTIGKFHIGHKSVTKAKFIHLLESECRGYEVE